MDYTQPDPPASGEQPDAGSPPAYQPPPAGGPPPSQLPYQPTGVHPAAPPPPPPPKKGFNWLACCGISCVVILLVGGGIGYCGFRMMQPFFSVFMELEAVNAEIEQTNLATIKVSALPIDAATLSSNPDQYEGQWLELEGVVTSAGDLGGQSYSSGGFSTEETTNYMIDSILVMDSSRAPLVASPGDTITAYGKCLVLDFEKLPFFGKMIAGQSQSNSQLPGVTKMIFFLAKEVTLATDYTSDPSSDGNGTDGDGSGGASGWMK